MPERLVGQVAPLATAGECRLCWKFCSGGGLSCNHSRRVGFSYPLSASSRNDNIFQQAEGYSVEKYFIVIGFLIRAEK